MSWRLLAPTRPTLPGDSNHAKSHEDMKSKVIISPGEEDQSLRSLPGDSILDVVQQAFGHQGVFVQVHKMRGLNTETIHLLDMCTL